MCVVVVVVVLFEVYDLFCSNVQLIVDLLLSACERSGPGWLPGWLERETRPAAFPLAGNVTKASLFGHATGLDLTPPAAAR